MLVAASDGDALVAGRPTPLVGRGRAAHIRRLSAARASRAIHGRAVACGVVLGLTLAVGGCSGTPDTGNAGPASGPMNRAAMRIVVATHGQSADPFWSVVANGVRAAGRDLGVRVEYQAPVQFDMVAMSNLIDAAVASSPDGLVVSIPDAAALGASIRAAVARGIPVVSINSGDDVYRDLGVLLHVGQPEYDAGLGAGRRLAAAGVRRALCVNHELGNVSLDRRCDGFRTGLEEAGGVARLLAVDLADPDDAQQRIRSALTVDPELDGMLTLGPTGAGPALSALQDTGRSDQVAFATFDLTPEVAAAVAAGSMLLAVDQQPYLQGYLPIVALVGYLETLTLPGGGDVLKTGPRFVTGAEASRVLELSRRGLR